MASTPVQDVARQVWEHRLAREPYLRVRRGLPVEQLPSGSAAETEREAGFALRMLASLDAVDPAQASADDLATAGFLRFLLEGWARAPELHWHGFSCTPYSSFFLSFAVRDVFGGARFEQSADVDRYLSLLADYRTFVAELGTKLVGQRARGILLPGPAVPGVQETLRRHRDAAPAVLGVRDERLTALPSAEAGRLRDTAGRVVADEVVPAFDAVLALFDEEYLAAAPDRVGFAQYPGGEAFYREAVRVHTASAWEPERIHELGLEQVATLADEMGKVRAELGVTADERAFHTELRARFTATSPEQVEALYLRHMAALEPKISGWFRTLPRAAYGVERLPAHMEASMTYGYYRPPTPDAPTGRYMYNGSQLDQRSTLTAATLIFHELAPGHHFHLARQAEDAALPDVRREAMDLGAFNEGWAEYAAGLGWEMGLYDDVWDRYGRLVHERFTAQRLVVDTGLNLLGWSLERAREYMRANTTDSDVQVATETLRYSTDLPGQALAYRMGFLELQRLRADAEQRLGHGFDVRGYHEAVLGLGALPFPVLEGQPCGVGPTPRQRRRHEATGSTGDGGGRGDGAARGLREHGAADRRRRPGAGPAHGRPGRAWRRTRRQCVRGRRPGRPRPRRHAAARRRHRQQRHDDRRGCRAAPRRDGAGWRGAGTGRGRPAAAGRRTGGPRRQRRHDPHRLQLRRHRRRHRRRARPGRLRR